MIILLAIVAALILVGLLARRSRRFTLPADPAETRWWHEPAATRPGRITVREPYEQGEQ